ncbi:MAG: NAD-binding protein [Candidatus Nezhaarchaeales archaeon]
MEGHNTTVGLGFLQILEGVILRVFIAGAGDVGRNLAKMLAKKGNLVVVMDTDEEACKRLSREADVLVMTGDVTKLHVLRQAEVEKSDVAIAVTDRDEVNVLMGILAKELKVPRVIVRVSDERLIDVVEALGIEKAVCPELVTARIIESVVTRSYGLPELLAVGGNFKLMDVVISATSPAAGKTIKEIPLAPHWIILAVYEGDSFIKPSEELTIREGQRIIVLSSVEHADEVLKLFAG